MYRKDFIRKNGAISFSVLFFGLSFIFNAQEVVRTCGTVDYLQKQIEQDPSIPLKLEQIEKETQHFIEMQSKLKTNAAVITIPVVIHVVYNTTTQNISDAQIKSQMDILNNDYRRLNADTVNTPAAFKNKAADTKIEFCLAGTDPKGNPTTGIVRVKTNKTVFYYSDNGVKYTSTGGDDAWDANSYLNLWVCPLESSALGYTQFPGAGPLATDGVVITYYAFGTGVTAMTPFDLGRTTTHEVAHWLNIKHIWGSGYCGDDLVSDTPTQQGANSKCPTFPHTTCSNGANGDMFMNYMDYSDDICMNIFTAGQATRMLATLNGSRKAILSSNKCALSTSIPSGDVKGSAISVFPNPTSSILNIHFSGDHSGPIEMKLYNVMGEEVDKIFLKERGMDYQTDVSRFSDGIYFIEFREENITIRYKFLKN